MSEESVDARPLTSVELLDAAVWREIDSAKCSRRQSFCRRNRAWLGGGKWCGPRPREWKL